MTTTSWCPTTAGKAAKATGLTTLCLDAPALQGIGTPETSPRALAQYVGSASGVSSATQTFTLSRSGAGAEQVPEEARGVVEDLCLGGVLLDDARATQPRKGDQDEVCELLQRVPSQAILQVVAGGEIPQDPCAEERDPQTWGRLQNMPTLTHLPRAHAGHPQPGTATGRLAAGDTTQVGADNAKKLSPPSITLALLTAGLWTRPTSTRGGPQPAPVAISDL